MNTNLLRTSLLAVVAASAVYGQSSHTLKVNVPFDFIVGSRTLHAGQCAVNQAAASGAVIINGADRKGGAIVLGYALNAVPVQKDGKLVFHHYGNEYFLAEVWGAGNYGCQIPKTRRERELAATRLLPDNLTLVASR